MAQPNGSAKDCTSQWQHTVEEDGWYRAHNALRAQVKALEGMSATFQRQADAGVAITREQAAAATRFLDAAIAFLHHHHSKEEEIISPYLRTRFEVDANIEEGHKQLDELTTTYVGAVKKLLASTSLEEQRALVPAVTAALAPLKTLLLQHFKEEEEGVVVLMRKHFTPKEIEKNVVAPILRSLSADDTGIFFHIMSPEEKRGFARQEGIPFFIRWILAWQTGRYSRNVWQPFEQRCLTAAA